MSGMDHYLLWRGPPMELSLPALPPTGGGRKMEREKEGRVCEGDRHREGVGSY